jgi:hypothetical protein
MPFGDVQERVFDKRHHTDAYRRTNGPHNHGKRNLQLSARLFLSVHAFEIPPRGVEHVGD